MHDNHNFKSCHCIVTRYVLALTELTISSHTLALFISEPLLTAFNVSQSNIVVITSTIQTNNVGHEVDAYILIGEVS